MENVNIAGQSFVLLRQKCLFWPQYNWLIIADVHLGKSTHFRKSGIALSSGPQQKDFYNLSQLIEEVNPQHLIFLGDLFHSEHNVEWSLFSNWIRQYPGITFTLVEGNHDILSHHQYRDAGIRIEKEIMIDQFLFTHEPIERKGYYNICGHVHPGVRLVGKAYQAIRVPCFYIGEQRTILPAFGSLTGLFTVEPQKHEMVYGVSDSGLVRLL